MVFLSIASKKPRPAEGPYNWDVRPDEVTFDPSATLSRLFKTPIHWSIGYF
jgi:hypothetical protein